MALHPHGFAVVAAPSDSHRIVITGIGLTAPGSNSLREFRAALLAGRSGVTKYEIRYVGETLRRTLIERSSGRLALSAAETIRDGVASMSEMIRSQLRS